MSEPQIVTSENLAEFNAARLAKIQPATEAPKVEEAKPEGSEPEAKKEPESEKPVEKKPNPKLEKRFSELTAKRDAAQEEAKRERERAEALEARLKALEEKATTPQAKAPEGRPNKADYKDAFEYAEALAEWKAKEVLKERETESARQAELSKQEQANKVWSDRLAATKAELPDFEEMVSSSDISVSAAVREAIVDSEVGPRILYHLAEHPELAEKLNGLSPYAAVREIGKLEELLSKKPEKKEEPEKKVAKSNAPEPIVPLKGGNAVPDTLVDGNGVFKGSFSDYKRLRAAGKIK